MGVKERVKKLDKLRKKVGSAEAFTAAANVKAEKASKLDDRQRQRRANQEEENAQKMIKKKIQVQKMAATSETINKGKLLMASRTLESSIVNARELREKNTRVRLQNRKMQEEREKRSASLESKNKLDSKAAALANEKALKAEAKA